jgi:putative inorganic carbon (HCO3(-)) transporter
MNPPGTRIRGTSNDLPWVVGNDRFSVRGVPTIEESNISTRAFGPFPELGANSLIVALLSPFFALTTSYVQRILFAVVILDIPIELGTYLFYRPTDAALGALKGLSISATTIALAGLYVSWIIRAATDKRHEVRSSLQFNVALLFYLAITTLSAFVAEDATLSLFELYLLLEACLIYFYVANHVRSRRDVVFVTSMLMAGCLVESIVILVMRLTVSASTTWDFPIHILAENLGSSGGMRIGGTIGVPNVAGAYLSIMLVFAVSILFTNLGRMHRWLALAVIVLGSVALIFTFSRGGWIALVVGMIVLGFSIWRQRGVSLKAPIAAVALLALVYLPFQSSVSTRLFGDDQGSAGARVPLNMLALRMIADNPILGVGANNFTVAMKQYVTSDFRHEWLWAVHNKYLLVLAETGIGGLLAYLAFLLGTMRRGWRCWKFRDSLLSPLALGLTAGIAGNMVHQSVDLFRDRPIQQLLWLVAGLLAAMYRIFAARGEQKLPSEVAD